MGVILLTIPISLILTGGFIWAFFWAAKKGQFDHIDLEAHRILNDGPRSVKPETNLENNKVNLNVTDDAEGNTKSALAATNLEKNNNKSIN